VKGFVAAILAFGVRAAAADECFDSPAVCHLKTGKALLESDPKRASDELYASYKADPKTSTLALYALALERDHRFATSAIYWRRVRARLSTELEDTKQRAVGEATAIEREIKTADSELSGLESHIARVHLRYGGGSAQNVVVARKGEGDVLNAFTDEILVNAPSDQLTVTYGDGQVKQLAIEIAGGGEQTIVVAAPAPPASPTPPVLPIEHAESVPSRPPGAEPSSQPNYLGWSLAAGGTVAIGIGIAFWAAESSKWNDARNAGCLDSGGCPASAQPLGDRANLYGELAIASAVLGVGLGAAAAYAFLRHREASTVVGVVPTATGAAAIVMGRF
jgi:hypothetical protein